MKKFLFNVCFLLIIQISYAQVSVRVFNYRPTGEFGSVMKPAYSFEVGYMKPFEEDDRIRFNISGTFLIMKPRLAVFPIYAVENGTKILPGEQSFQKFNLFKGFIGYDYAFLKRKKMIVYGGVDIILGTAQVNYTSKIETLRDEKYVGGGVLFGFRFRLGVEYELTPKMSVFASANRQYFLLFSPPGLYSANDYGLGFHYLFNQ